MRYLKVLSVALAVIPRLVQAAPLQAKEQAAIIEFAQTAVARALDYSQGDRQSLVEAQDDFTVDGWREFMKWMEGWLDSKGTPLSSSSFMASGDAAITNQENGLIHLTVPGVLKQSQNKSSTTYRVVVDVLVNRSPLKITHLEPVVYLTPRTGSNNTSRDESIATNKLQEKAVQTGDGNQNLSLQPQAKLVEELGALARERLRAAADPSMRYEAIASKIRNDHAAVLGKVTFSTSTTPQYYLAKFVREKETWKIVADELNEKPISAAALEAAVPAKDGAFTRAGSPWHNVAYSTANTKWFKENEIAWKLQAVQDESFLYIRFGGKAELPPPGTEIPAEDAKGFKGIPPAPDVFVIRTASGSEFKLMLSANPLTRATFDERGRATSNRYFVEYSLTVRNAVDQTLFSNGTRDTFEPLIAVHDRLLDVKIPLKSLGIVAESAGTDIREANSLAKILPYRVTW